jgi:hypothetical protein
MYVRQWLDNEYGKAEATPYKKLYGKDIVIMERSFIEGEIKKGIFQKQIFSDLALKYYNDINRWQSLKTDYRNLVNRKTK